MIYIEPQAGLCNRMRAIESAYQIAKEMNKKLCIVWCCNVDCMAKFSDLFEDIPDVEVIEIPALFGIRTTVRYQRLRIKHIMQRCIAVEKLERCDGNEEVVRRFVAQGTVYVQSFGVWYPYEKNLGFFRPVAEIEKMISFKKSEFGNECIGVHIRRTDNVKSITESGTDVFIERMQAEIDRNPNVTFFLASDAQHEKDTIINLFGKRIKWNEDSELKRTSKEGMRIAVKDLFLLASCDKIIGSAGSSYSEMAAEIGNVECCVVRKEK